jgi:hypothetical protein
MYRYKSTAADFVREKKFSCRYCEKERDSSMHLLHGCSRGSEDIDF